jgi:hypothetical protein
MRFPRCFAGAAAAVLLLHGAGCADKDSPVKVSGSVYLNGQPVRNVRVNATPVKGHGRPAYGTTDSSGKFSLTTFQEGDGALPGQYNVTIEPIDTGAADRTKALMDPKLDPKERKRIMDEPAAPPSDDTGIPDKYRNGTTSDLMLKVPPKGKVQFDLTPSGT